VRISPRSATEPPKKTVSQQLPPPTGEIILYSTGDGRTRAECRFAGETVWLTQALMAKLFDVSVPTVNEHLHNIFEEAELDPEATIRKFRIVRREGTREVTRLIDHYNLDAILAVDYRVRSPRGVQFRRWAADHSAKFWLTAQSLCRDTERARQWLCRHQAQLQVDLAGIMDGDSRTGG